MGFVSASPCFFVAIYPSHVDLVFICTKLIGALFPRSKTPVRNCGRPSLPHPFNLINASGTRTAPRSTASLQKFSALYCPPHDSKRHLINSTAVCRYWSHPHVCTDTNVDCFRDSGGAARFNTLKTWLERSRPLPVRAKLGDTEAACRLSSPLDVVSELELEIPSNSRKWVARGGCVPL